MTSVGVYGCCTLHALYRLAVSNAIKFYDAPAGATVSTLIRHIANAFSSKFAITISCI